jgi:hypothetical protein
MSDPDRRINTAASDDLPAIVYTAAAGAALLFLALAWIFFGEWSHMGLVLAIVTVFFLMALGIPFALWLAWRKDRAPESVEEPMALRQWAASDFGTWQGSLKGANAAAEILLPIAATAVGMIAIGVVFYVVSAGAS